MALLEQLFRMFIPYTGEEKILGRGVLVLSQSTILYLLRRKKGKNLLARAVHDNNLYHLSALRYLLFQKEKKPPNPSPTLDTTNIIYLCMYIDVSAPFFPPISPSTTYIHKYIHNPRGEK